MTSVANPRASAGLALALTLSLLATACGGSDENADTADAGGANGSQIEQQETFEADSDLLDRQFGTTENVPDPVLAALNRAGQDIDAETRELAIECYREQQCEPGEGEITVALADGFGDNQWRQVHFMEFILQALTYPDVGRILYTNAGGSATKAVSDLRGLIAQDADVITGFFDAGEAVLPTIREATDRGVVVVPSNASVGGTPGEDYLSFVVEDLCELGENFAQILNEELGEQGNVAFLGGTPGNQLSAAWQACEREALASGITLVGTADTNWTQQGTFQAVSGFLSRTELDGISYEYGDGFLGGVRAYEAANKPLDVVLTLRNDENNLFCEWKEIGNPNFQIFYSSGGGYYIRLALTAAMMELQGYDVPANIEVPQRMREVTEETCNPELPGPAPVSTLVPQDVLDEMFG
jgi:ribose transport system substrate-binding protein